MAFLGDLQVGGTSIQTIGVISDFGGIFSDGPLRGDNVIYPGVAGETHMPKVRGAYDFSVPLTLRTAVGSTAPLRANVLAAVASLSTLLNSSGAPLSLTRLRPAVAGGTTSQTCTGEYVNGLDLELVGFTAGRVVIVLRNLSGVWT